MKVHMCFANQNVHMFIQQRNIGFHNIFLMKLPREEENVQSFQTIHPNCIKVFHPHPSIRFLITIKKGQIVLGDY